MWVADVDGAGRMLTALGSITTTMSQRRRRDIGEDAQALEGFNLGGSRNV
jgi:hypothetical protein